MRARCQASMIFGRNSLTTDQIRQIVDVQLAKLGKHLVDQRITIDVTDAAKNLLAREGYDRMYGPRRSLGKISVVP